MSGMQKASGPVDQWKWRGEVAEDWEEQEEREQGLHSVIWAASKRVLNRDHRFVIEWDISEDTFVDYNRLF